MSFLTKFFGVKGKQIKEGAANILVSIDPESASEAEVEAIREDLEEVTEKVVIAEIYLEKESAETKVEEDKVNNAMGALEILQADFETAEGSEKSAIEADMIGLMDEVDEASSELERELQEDAEAKEDLDFWKTRQKELADYLKKTKNNGQKVIKALERQKAATKRAKEREKFGEAGHTESTASSAMERKLAQLKAEERVSTQMTDLTSDKSITKSSDRVKAAMAKARGEVDTSKMSLQDRMTQMKEKHG